MCIRNHNSKFDLWPLTLWVEENKNLKTGQSYWLWLLFNLFLEVMCVCFSKCVKSNSQLVWVFVQYPQINCLVLLTNNKQVQWRKQVNSAMSYAVLNMKMETHTNMVHRTILRRDYRHQENHYYQSAACGSWLVNVSNVVYCSMFLFN